LKDMEIQEGELNAAIKRHKTRLRYYKWGIFISLGLSLCLALFGRFTGFTLAPLVGWGLVAYIAIFGLAISYLGNNRITSLTQDLDVLISKRQIAEKYSKRTEIKEDKSSYFDQLVDINITNLGIYYEMVQRHADKSFSTSIIAGVIGFALLAFGIIIGFWSGQNAKTITYISSGSGIFIQFISVVFFGLYTKTIRELKGYHDSLLYVQNVLLSFKLIDDIQIPDERSKLITIMLSSLVANNNSFNIFANKDKKQDTAPA